MIKWAVRRIAIYLGRKYPGELNLLLGATEANIAAVLEGLSERPEAFTIRTKLRRHAGDERHHSVVLFQHANRDDLATLAGKRLDKTKAWTGEGEGIQIRGVRKRIPAFRFLFWGQDPLDMPWCDLFALITLLETYSAVFYGALSSVPGFGFTERIYQDEITHTSLWESHPERLLYWRVRIVVAMILTVLTGGLNLNKQTLE